MKRRRAPDAANSPARRWRRREHPDKGDAGSVTPLIIGMVACLLLLTAGVTAAGSAFLAGRRLQNLCDGAAAAAVGAMDPTGRSQVRTQGPARAAAEYLAIRGREVTASVDTTNRSVRAVCRIDAPITFGFLFGVPYLRQTAVSTGTALYSATHGAFPLSLPHPDVPRRQA